MGCACSGLHRVLNTGSPEFPVQDQCCQNGHHRREARALLGQLLVSSASLQQSRYCKCCGLKPREDHDRYYRLTVAPVDGGDSTEAIHALCSTPCAYIYTLQGRGRSIASFFVKGFGIFYPFWPSTAGLLASEISGTGKSPGWEPTLGRAGVRPAKRPFASY